MVSQTTLNSDQIVGVDSLQKYDKLINLTIIAKNIYDIYDVYIIATFIDANTLLPD